MINIPFIALLLLDYPIFHEFLTNFCFSGRDGSIASDDTFGRHGKIVSNLS
jgi:hypothetical protein